jgi:hypothetical protein
MDIPYHAAEIRVKKKRALNPASCRNLAPLRYLELSDVAFMADIIV